MLAWVTNPTSYAPALRWVTVRNGAIIDERCGTRWAAMTPADAGHPDPETEAAGLYLLATCAHGDDRRGAEIHHHIGARMARAESCTVKSTTYRLLYASLCAMHPERDPKSFAASEIARLRGEV